MPLLEVISVSKNFGGLAALKKLSFTMNETEIVGLIGPNGAGKTSFFNCLTGILKVDSGDLYFKERNIRLNPLGPNRILEAGIARTFQNLRLFKNMTVLENVMIGLHSRTRSGLWDALLRSRRHREEERMIVTKSLDLLAFIGLEAQADESAGNLPYGSQKRLEIARAMATEPKLLLLDEPVAGMNPVEKDEIITLVRRIRERGIGVLIIEHDMRVVMPLSDRIVVMDEGSQIAEGAPGKIRSDPRVIQAYLGVE